VLLTDSSDFAGVLVSSPHVLQNVFFLFVFCFVVMCLADPSRLSCCLRSCWLFVAVRCCCRFAPFPDTDNRLWASEARVVSLVTNHLLRYGVVHGPGSETPAGRRHHRSIHTGRGHLEFGSHFALHAVWPASRLRPRK
jgi:hypothetical protein